MKKAKNTQTAPVAAVSTSPGRSAVAVVRLSGKGCIEIAKTIFSPFPSRSNELKHGVLSADGLKDDAMCVWFNAPRSYTGEDMVEFHTHGGFFVSQAVVEACVARGCRVATNGEFTKRAYLNGKLKLTEAEGIIDVIDAESKRAANNGYNLLAGKLNGKILEIQDELTNLLAQVEVTLDYPEEELDMPRFEAVLSEIDFLLATARQGKLIKNGVEVVIAGETNVGKSSLLNALVGYDRAIVTEIEGTTRDTLTQSVIYKDVKFNFTDTAGLRGTNDPVEKLGVQRAEEAIKNADIVLLVLDATKPAEKIAADDRTIVLFNKTDIADKSSDGLEISALTGYNIEKVKEEIYKKTQIDKIDSSDVLLTNNRHIDCLQRAAAALRRTQADATPDCVASDLAQCWEALGEITGKSLSEEVISRIFEKFCVGK